MQSKHSVNFLNGTNKEGHGKQCLPCPCPHPSCCRAAVAALDILCESCWQYDQESLTERREERKLADVAE